MRRTSFLLSSVALSFLAACAEDAGEAPASAGAAREPSPVLVHDVGAPLAAAPVRAAGTVRLRRETPLAFWTAGRIARIDVREGDRVRSGQPLAQLDTQTIDSDVSAARAEAVRTNQELARQKKLIAEGWVTRARLDSAEAAAGAARAQLDRALFAQRNARITAPAEGIVLARLAEPGETVASGEPVLVVGEYRAGHVLRVPLAPADMVGLATGMPADVRFPDGAAPAMAGTIVELAGRADERTGTFQVEVALPAHPALRSGLIGEAVIARAPGSVASSGPLLVPATALFAARAGEAFVWKIDGRGRVAAVLVSTGPVREDGVVITAGLAPGDRIVRSGVDRLAAGDPVRPATETARAP